MSLVVVVSNAAVPLPVNAALESLGFDVVCADSVKLAVELCTRRQALLVVTDSSAFAQMLAAEERRVPIVACLTEALDADQLLSLWRAGVADYWYWPRDSSEVGARVALLNHRREAVALEAEQTLANHLVEVQRDQRAGRYVQMGMLPPSPMAIDGYRFEHRVQPSLILSGDFVDYFAITDQHFACYVADVSGHGASSAFVTVLLKNFSRRIRREYRRSMLTDPGEVLSWLNAELLEQQIDKHVAIFFAICDTGSNVLHYVNAGQFPPAILVGNERTRTLDEPGKPVGLFSDIEYTTAKLVMHPGERLVVFTDGVLETAEGEDLMAKEANIVAQATEQPTLTALWSQLGLESQVSPDDVTALMVTRES
ncbi:MAG: PP2C family protein-serine/threonine phosphatase [Pseudomonadales bacterium]